MDSVQQLDSFLCHLATAPLEQCISETCRAMPCQSQRVLRRQSAALLGLMRGKVKLGTSCWTALMLLRPT